MKVIENSGIFDGKLQLLLRHWKSKMRGYANFIRLHIPLAFDRHVA